MDRIWVFGNNATGALCPTDADDPPDILVRSPIALKLSQHDACEILWHTWACTIVKTLSGLKAWGETHAGFIEMLGRLAQPKLIGHDEVKGYLGQDGHLYDLEHRQSGQTWKDAAIDGLGKVYTANDGAIFRYASMEFAISGQQESTLEHPALKDSIRLFALESRCFVSSGVHLFEVCKDRLRLIETLEGLVFKVIAGRRNRLGIVTNAGDAYVLDTRDEEPALLELNENVRFLGLGSDFEVAVTDKAVLSRGSSKCTGNHSSVLIADQFGQLGRDGPEAEWAEINARAAEITGIRCSRWATMLVMRHA